MPGGSPVKMATALFRSIKVLASSVWLTLLVLLSAPTYPAAMQALGYGSYAQIELSYAGLPFIVALWSLDCPPCMKELEMLSHVHRKYPEFAIVLINTDGVDANNEAESLLTSFNLNSTDAWIFGSQQAEKLRFSIDPQWYGELPRSYLYQNDERRGHSGLIDQARLLEWLDSVLPASE